MTQHMKIIFLIVFSVYIISSCIPPQKKELVEVKVDLTEDKESIVVSISDTGIGIPKEQQPRIFTKFFSKQFYQSLYKAMGFFRSNLQSVSELLNDFGMLHNILTF